MRIKATERLKVNGQTVRAGEITYIDDEAGAAVIARGAAIQIRRATRVGLNLETNETTEARNNVKKDRN